MILDLIVIAAPLMMVLLFGFKIIWASKNRLKIRSIEEVGHLVSAEPFRWFWLVFGLLFLFAAVIQLVNGHYVLGLSTLAANAFITYIFATDLLANHRVTAGGLEYSRRFRSRRRRMEWSTVTSVRISRNAFRLESTSGDVVTIPFIFMGLPEFATAVLDGVQSTAIDRQTRLILGRTTAGDLP